LEDVEEMRLIDAKQASELLGVRLARLYELVRLKTLPFVRLGSRQIRFDPDELSEWAKQGGTGQGEASDRAVELSRHEGD
jgi:excisionase family DNA binding protein